MNQAVAFDCCPGFSGNFATFLGGKRKRYGNQPEKYLKPVWLLQLKIKPKPKSCSIEIYISEPKTLTSEIKKPFLYSRKGY